MQSGLLPEDKTGLDSSRKLGASGIKKGDNNSSKNRISWIQLLSASIIY